MMSSCILILSGVKTMEKICILCAGEIGSSGGTLRGAGIEIQVPENAIAPGECTTVLVCASTEPSSLSKQSQLNFISPIFDVECLPYVQLKKEVTLTIEHFAELETERDLDDMVFLVSKSGEEFHQCGQVESRIGSRQAEVTVLHFCRFAVGKRNSESNTNIE